MNPEAFSDTQFNETKNLKITATQIDSDVFENFISRFSNLQTLNLDNNDIRIVKDIPETIEDFSIIHNPLNICTFDSVMALINKKDRIRIYSGVTMKCWNSDMTPEEVFVKLSLNQLNSKQKNMEDIYPTLSQIS